MGAGTHGSGGRRSSPGNRGGNSGGGTSGGGGGGNSGGGGGGGRTGSGRGNLRGKNETNRQRFNRQVNSRIKSRNRGPNAAQSAYQAGYRGWSVGASGSWSGGNIGDSNSPAAKAYRSQHGEAAYKSMVKAKGYKGTGASSSKSWSSIAFGDQPESDWSKLIGDWNRDVMNPLGDKVISGIGNYLRDTAVDTFNAVREGYSMDNLQRLSDQYNDQIGDPEAREQSIKDAVGSWFNPQRNEMALGHQVAQIAKFKFHDVPKSLLSLAPGPQREGILRSLRESQPDHEGLRAFSNLAGGIYGVAGGVGMIRGGLPGQGLFTGKAGGLSQLKRITNLGRAERIARMPSAVKASRIGPTTGLGGWWNKGRNLQVPNENVAGWGKLWGNDLSQIGKFPRNIPFKGIGPTQRVFDKGLLGTGLPKNMRQLGQFVQGKGGLTWSGSRGVPTGPTPAVRQAFERPLRGIRGRAVRAGGDLQSLMSRPVGAAVGALGVGAGASILTARGVKGGLDAAVSDKAQLKTMMDFLGSQKVEDFAEWTQGDSWLQKQVASYTGDTIRHLADPAIKYARDLPGFVGIVGKIQAGKLERRSEAGNIPGSLDTLLGSYDLATRYPDQPGIRAELGGRLKQFGQFLNNQDVQSVRDILGQQPQRTRRERVRNLRESGYGTGGRNNQMRIQSFDPNKINIQANPYGQAQAASEESELAAFWQRQNQLDAAADQRLKDIQSDQSDYTKLIEQLTQQQTGYTDELARIQPIGQGLEDELARLKPIGTEMSAELERIKPYGKQYTDELERLKPFDQMFRDELRFGIDAGWDRPDRYGKRRSGDSWDREGNYISGGLSGREFIAQNDRWYRGTRTPYTTQLLKDYQEYLTGVENLQQWQKDHETHLGQLETSYKDYQDHLSGIQTQQKEYQDYLSQLQTEQSDLTSYSTEVGRRSRALDDYSTLFSSARQASDEAARTYTIRSQQGISSEFRPGVSGIRAARGYSTYGRRRRDRSPKKRFNRDFRIGSFGDTAPVQSINV